MPMRSRRAFIRPRSARALAPLVALCLAACGGNDPLGPPAPLGSYRATEWTAVENNMTTDILAAGGSFVITLTAQGTTTGRVFIPDAVTGEGDLDSDLAGTWTQNGSIIDFSHTADTFVRDMPFTVQGETLVGDRAFGSVRIRVILTRLP